MKLRYEFEDHGGYDCMSGAFKIYDTDVKTRWEGDKLICVIDQKDYNKRDFDINAPEPDYEYIHTPWPECEAMAKLIVDSVNEKLAGEEDGTKI
jgi:hypothetical protein